MATLKKILFSCLTVLGLTVCTLSFEKDASAADLECAFDEGYYAQTYPDVVAVFGNSRSALLSHWLTYGVREGRSGSAGFSPISAGTPSLFLINCGGYQVGNSYRILGDLYCSASMALAGSSCSDVRAGIANWNSATNFARVFSTDGFNRYFQLNPDVASWCSAYYPPQLQRECAERHWVEYGMFEGRRTY